MFASLRWTITVLCLLALAPSAASQHQVDGFQPTEGTLGTSIRVDGTGFGDPGPGTKRPILRLAHLDGSKPLKQKVDGFNDVTVYAEVRKLKQLGEYQVLVSAPPWNALTLPGTFTIRPPVLTHSTLDYYLSGMPVVLEGEFLGGRKPRVWIGGRKARVTEWYQDPLSPQALVIVSIPRGLPDGPQAVTFRNRLATVELVDAFSVVDSGVKCKPYKSKLVAHLAGQGVPSRVKSKQQSWIGWTMEPLVFEEVASPASNDELDAMPDQVAELARCAGTLARAFVREAMADAAAAGTEAEPETLTMLLGVKPGKVVRLVGIAVPDWDPVLEGSLLGGEAVSRGAVAVYMQGKNEEALQGWAGWATSAELFVETWPPCCPKLSGTFSAPTMPLDLGQGTPLIELEDAVILNARQGTLE